MGFDRPETVVVPKKDLRRLYALVTDMKRQTRDPELDEMEKILRRNLKLGGPQYQHED